MLECDIVVVGGGHAGIEAVTIIEQLSLKTAFITLDKNKIGYPSCNPSIGGIAKSHLVYELDVFGGLMPILTDSTGIHNKLLNSSKGPAVWSLRTQIDSDDYPADALKRISSFKNTLIVEDEVLRIETDENRVTGVVCEKSGFIKAEAVVIATGTFLGGRIFIGHDSFPAGRYSEKNSQFLSDSLKNLRLSLIRLKTGTPSRSYRDSIDFSKLEEQAGEEETGSFSVLSNDKTRNIEKCFIGHTNLRTHEIIKDNLQSSALYSGLITGIGPRYCPSIEDKIVRFAGRESHTVFIEPMGIESELMYINGTSSSLPEEIQYKFLRTILGFENIRFFQPGYAIEYDAVDTREIKPTMETKKIEGLYLAGQINGTSGYEEAAAQGFTAGLNSALKVLRRDEIIFDRYTNYIGVLTDDLVKKEIKEPYRLFTSRSENRLALRQDNNFVRMIPYADKVGLDNPSLTKYKKINEEYLLMKTELFNEKDELKQKYKIFNDPSKSFLSFRDQFPEHSRRALLAMYSEIKYAGYIERYRRTTKRILYYKDYEISSKEILLSSNIISKEAKEVIKISDIQKVRDLFGLIDPSDIENVILILKKK
ncbi:TPA: tRNA uridine-5-carboxymethylaminomethyl(34) synthesis enzyme MnmG [candidate division WOR-3 bacterium]|jgi:tRNA uridine 5-carboxymethylaminomethyl modification enzyme|uniref:tRNA uridine 5-carboxymethylaminomethyl modification enzyme MnmG n=1 Tax=candidate division WOR-3 bacterium TaxID=2052148 RepID=A0A350H9J8_UNCW3|nr:tRNA uridine-5-carboxymethylaminomethyl(34) synthesis enzyme MnmG [candidate division WOR-3 bacterium]